MEHEEDLAASPAVRAAVSLERRFAGIDTSLALILQSVRGVEAEVAGVKEQVKIANGRTSTNEGAIASLNAVVRGDRGVLVRLGEAEENLEAVVKHGTYADGVEDGKVSIRTSDKWGFGIALTILIVGIQIAVQLLGD